MPSRWLVRSLEWSRMSRRTRRILCSPDMTCQSTHTWPVNQQTHDLSVNTHVNVTCQSIDTWPVNQHTCNLSINRHMTCQSTHMWPVNQQTHDLSINTQVTCQSIYTWPVNQHTHDLSINRSNSTVNKQQPCVAATLHVKYRVPHSCNCCIMFARTKGLQWLTAPCIHCVLWNRCEGHESSAENWSIKLNSINNLSDYCTYLSRQLYLDSNLNEPSAPNVTHRKHENQHQYWVSIIWKSCYL